MGQIYLFKSIPTVYKYVKPYVRKQISIINVIKKK